MLLINRKPEALSQLAELSLQFRESRLISKPKRRSVDQLSVFKRTTGAFPLESLYPELEGFTLVDPVNQLPS